MKNMPIRANNITVLMNTALQRQMRLCLSQKLRETGVYVSADHLAQLLLKLVDWSLVSDLVAMNAAQVGNLLPEDEKEAFITRYTRIMFTFSTQLKRFLSDNVLRVHRGEDIPLYRLSHDEINAAHVRFCRQLALLWRRRAEPTFFEPEPILGKRNMESQNDAEDGDVTNKMKALKVTRG